MPQIQRDRQFDWSLGIQNASSWLLRRSNEVVDARNAVFNKVIGAIACRDGYVREGQQFHASNPPKGYHVAKFREGSRRLVAVKNDAGNAMTVRVQVANDTWSEIISDLPVNSEVFFTDHLNEVYVSGYDTVTGNPITPRNIAIVSGNLNVSTTRNLLGCPPCYYFVVYLGLLYAVNCSVDGVRYPDRIYKSSPPTATFTFVRGAQSGTITTLAVDSVRYIKPGRVIEIFQVGTETLRYRITVGTVDKANNTFTFTHTPSSGSPVTSFTFTDNDELVLDGRRNKVGFLWNTDYPASDQADFIAVQPGTDSSNAITAAIQSSNRLFIFTDNSMSKFDGNNLIIQSSSIGCVNQRVLKNIDDDWMIWLDSDGKLRARNDSSGQQEYISRGIHRNFMDKMTTANFSVANAVVFNERYKIYLGTIGTRKYRIVYDFGANTIEIESHAIGILMQGVDSVNGKKSPYFVSETGRLYKDEVADTDDDGVAIPFMVEIGRNNQGHEGEKKYDGVKVYSEKASGVKVFVAIEGGQHKRVGELTKSVEYIKFKETGGANVTLDRGTSSSLKFVASVKGESPIIEGAVTYFSIEEDIPGNG